MNLQALSIPFPPTSIPTSTLSTYIFIYSHKCHFSFQKWRTRLKAPPPSTWATSPSASSPWPPPSTSSGPKSAPLNAPLIPQTLPNQNRRNRKENTNKTSTKNRKERRKEKTKTRQPHQDLPTARYQTYLESKLYQLHFNRVIRVFAVLLPEPQGITSRKISWVEPVATRAEPSSLLLGYSSGSSSLSRSFSIITIAKKRWECGIGVVFRKVFYPDEWGKYKRLWRLPNSWVEVVVTDEIWALVVW